MAPPYQEMSDAQRQQKCLALNAKRYALLRHNQPTHAEDGVVGYVGLLFTNSRVFVHVVRDGTVDSRNSRVHNAFI